MTQQMMQAKINDNAREIWRMSSRLDVRSDVSSVSLRQQVVGQAQFSTNEKFN